MRNTRRFILLAALIVAALPFGYAALAGIGASSEVNAQGSAPNQICFGRGAAAATIYVTGDRFDIYAIDPQDKGELVMSFSQEYLRTIPAEGEARLLGESDRHIPIAFYRNANRLYRMVAGPDAAGKFFECTFNAVCSHERTWIGETSRPTDEVVPVCDPAIVLTAGLTSTPTTGVTAGPTGATGASETPTNTQAGPTNTPTFTPTDTPTDVPSETPTETFTPTDTPTNTPSFTPTDTDLPV